MALPPLATIGYEGCRIDDVVDRLAGARIDLLIDVRAIAGSRKPGFSKRQLAAALDARGISYLHLRALGTPKPGRIAARAGRPDEMRAIFADHMRAEAPQRELATAIGLARQRRCCLLCFEADHRDCHRDVVARMICAATDQRTDHLAAPITGP